MKRWVSDLKRRVKAVSDDPIGIEHLFDYIEYDLELWKIKHHFSCLRRERSSTTWGMVKSIECWRKIIQEETWEVLIDRQEKSDLSSITSFAKHLNTTDTIITFNYDTLLENALDDLSIKWSYGFDYSSQSITIFKMHGSLNWFLAYRGIEVTNPEEHAPLYQKKDIENSKLGAEKPKDLEDLYNLYHRKDYSKCRCSFSYVQNVPMVPNVGYLPNRPGIASFGRVKKVSTLPGMGKVWYGAFDALKKANEAMVIGFSLSPYDEMTRFHFSHVIHTLREETLQKATVVDPNAAQLKCRYDKLFNRKTELKKYSTETADWDEILL